MRHRGAIICALLSFVVSRHSLLMLELRRFLSPIWMTSYTESSFKIVYILFKCFLRRICSESWGFALCKSFLTPLRGDKEKCVYWYWSLRRFEVCSTSTINSFLFLNLSALYIHVSKKVVSVSDTSTVNLMVSLWLFASSICIPRWQYVVIITPATETSLLRTVFFVPGESPHWFSLNSTEASAPVGCHSESPRPPPLPGSTATRVSAHGNQFP